MCYSKEVQLISALIILVSCLVYYLFYIKKFKDKWKVCFLRTVLIGFMCIGLHQFFEFLALVTNNQIVYKMGLIISICAVYFLLKSLEVLSNKKIGSWIALIFILFVILQILIVPMDFSASSFYLKHNSVFFWAAIWLLLFIYWHVCAIKIYFEMKDNKSKRTLVLYLLTIADASFILSAIYVLFGYFFFSVNVCTDSPSIWCTFYVLQSFLVPFLFFKLFKFKRQKDTKFMEPKEILIYLIIALFILGVLMLILPLFNCLTWKFVFG